MPPKNEASETEQEPQEATEQERAKAAFAELLSESETPGQERATGEAERPQAEPPQITAEQIAKLLAAKPELAEALADSEPVRRRIQGEADKRLDRFRRDAEAARAQEAAQQQQKAEQQRLAEMDDEDYGRTMREQAAKQQSAQEQVSAGLSEGYRHLGEMLLEAIPDPQERQRINEGTYSSWEEFTKACVTAAGETSAKQRLAKREKVQSESATKGETADEVETAAAIITGVGAPGGASKASFKRLSEDEQWRIALKRAFDKQ